MKVVGFVDDDLNKSAMIIHGLRVLGTSESLQRLVLRYNVDEVIITGAMFEPAARKRSVTIAAEAMQQVQAAGSRNLTSSPPRSSLSSREAVPS